MLLRVWYSVSKRRKGRYRCVLQKEYYCYYEERELENYKQQGAPWWSLTFILCPTRRLLFRSLEISLPDIDGAEIIFTEWHCREYDGLVWIVTRSLYYIRIWVNEIANIVLTVSDWIRPFPLFNSSRIFPERRSYMYTTPWSLPLTIVWQSSTNAIWRGRIDFSTGIRYVRARSQELYRYTAAPCDGSSMQNTPRRNLAETFPLISQE